MNESGKAVREIKNYYKIPIDKTIIVFDDLDLNVGQIRIKRGGGGVEGLAGRIHRDLGVAGEADFGGGGGAAARCLGGEQAAASKEELVAAHAAQLAEVEGRASEAVAALEQEADAVVLPAR